MLSNLYSSVRARIVVAVVIVVLVTLAIAPTIIVLADGIGGGG
jgi:hypothetical protein